MWSSIKRWFTRTPNAAERLLNHFDKLAGSEPEFVMVPEEGADPPMFLSIYRGYPTQDAITAFTVGLSHTHLPGSGGHKELVISVRDTDIAWAFACGCVALKLRDKCAFACGDAINFQAQIAESSEMSAFLVTHPRHIAPTDSAIDLGVRQVDLVELVPLYEEERAWLEAGGDVKRFLTECTNLISLDPKRKTIVPV